MTRITHYLILPFVRTPSGDLVGIEAEEAPTQNQAEFRAAALVGRRRSEDIVVGTVVVSHTNSPDASGLNAVVILTRYGETPDSMVGTD